MPRRPPETKTTPGAQTNVIDAAPRKPAQNVRYTIPPTKPGIIMDAVNVFSSTLAKLLGS